jgi:transcriptional regulator with XRE-family HTH domain
MSEQENISLPSPPDLKKRIEAILKMRDFTYTALVDHLGITERELDNALAQSTIEIRTLEKISKALRIPLYSFFRHADQQPDEENPHNYYNVNIWAPEEIQLRTENENLRQEVDRLRLEVAKKEILIQGLEEQLKAKT